MYMYTIVVYMYMYFISTGKIVPLLLPADKTTLEVKGQETEPEDIGGFTLAEAEQVSTCMLCIEAGNDH